MTVYRGFGCLCIITLCFQVMRSQSQPTQEQGLDCSDIWQKNKNAKSGVYTIKPNGASNSFQVFCDITESKGMTVIQNRNGFDGLLFNETWQAYENGFGYVTGEHWLGLEKISALTRQSNRQCKLYISLEDFTSKTAYAEYQTFSVGPASDYYRLSVGNYAGTAGDSFKGTSAFGSNQYGSAFSTVGTPHDNCAPRCIIGDIIYLSCSDIVQSGWWFNACGVTNLNGIYRTPPKHKFRNSFLSWPSWRPLESLKSTKMSVNCS